MGFFMDWPKTPPYLADASGYCYQATDELLASHELAFWYGRVAPDGYLVPGTQLQGPWHGATVACLASGPSLTREDCALVAHLPTVAANDTHRLASTHAAALAVDHGWWQQHAHETGAAGSRWTTGLAAAREFDLHLVPPILNRGRGNSGAQAIALAIALGAARVILLGYDCSLARGVHWHGPHTRTGNPDAAALVQWREHFEQAAVLARSRGVTVVNCSRHTELTSFERGDLDIEMGKSQALV